VRPAWPPIEPDPTGWQFPLVQEVEPEGLVAIGADLQPGTLLAAYRNAYFPMPVNPSAIGWWSPDPRGVIEHADHHVSRSTRRSGRKFTVTTDQDFGAVVDACGDPDRPHGWITDEIKAAYRRLHELGWAHSIEVRADGELVGGLYGIGIGAFFAGESMFHRRPDASKVAVAAIVTLLTPHQEALFDVQWTTPHLMSLGANDMSRSAYLERLAIAISAPGPDWAQA
jgi:leucyl/phenylalanyl-tRNA--protein transferase